MDKIVKEFFAQLKKLGMLRVQKEITKVEFDGVVNTNLTKGKMYEVIALWVREHEDRSQGLNYVIINDLGILTEVSINWFKVLEVK